MPNYTELFFSTSTPSNPEVLRDISEAIGAELYESDEPYADYEAHLDEVNYDFKYGHDFEDDLGIPFERMPFILTIRGHRNEKEKEEKIAREVFQKLVDKNYRPVYIVRGLDEVLASQD